MGERRTSKSNPMERVANAVTSTVEHIFSVRDDLAAVVVTDLKNRADNEGLRVQQLKSLDPTAYEKGKGRTADIPWTGLFCSPGVFGEPGCLWWFSKSKSSSLQPLQVKLQPGDLAFYDYTQSHWWKRALQDETTRISGPYVDHSGTNSYVVTASRGVVLDDLMIGAIAADILVGTLQSVWQFRISRLPKPSSLVDEDGVVIATNAGKCSLGSCLPENENDTVVSIPGTSWNIITEKSVWYNWRNFLG